MTQLKQLATHPLPVYLAEHGVLDSTNLEAKRWLDTLSGLRIIEAKRQTAGYGRKGHGWVSDSAQNYYGTYCIAYPKTLRPGLFTLWVGSIVYQALKPLVTVGELCVKWPNDLCLIRPSGDVVKVGGFLTELVSGQALCGVGINFGSAPKVARDEQRGILEAGCLELPVKLGAQLIRHAFMSHVPLLAHEPYVRRQLSLLSSHMQHVSRRLNWYLFQDGELIKILPKGIHYPTGALRVQLNTGERRSIHHGSVYVCA